MDLEFKKNDRIVITKAARHHQAVRFISATKCVPAEVAHAVVRKVTNTKHGRKVHVWDDLGYGYAIMVDCLPDFMTVHKA